MCNARCVIFGATSLSEEEVKGKRVLEVGSYDVNGGLRPVIEQWRPAEYIGVDISEGPGVDIVCRAEDLVEEFGKQSFDIVISTELLEHVRDWQKVISNFKNVCRPGGVMLITTRSYGFGFHEAPFDYWRFEAEDMKNIFSDCEILTLERDSQNDPGVFVKVRKPHDFRENNLADYKLYSIVLGRKASKLDDTDLRCYRFRLMVFRLGFEKKTAVLTRQLGNFFYLLLTQPGAVFCKNKRYFQ